MSPCHRMFHQLEDPLVGSVEGGFGNTLLWIFLSVPRIFGFLLGFSLASGIASYHLLDEYKLASAALQASVEDLQSSTRKVARIVQTTFSNSITLGLQVSENIRRIEAVEKDVKLLAETSTTRDEASKVRSEMKKLYDSLHIGVWSVPPRSLTNPWQNSSICDPMSGESVRRLPGLTFGV